MLDPILIDRYRSLLDAHLAERTHAFPNELQAVNRRLAAMGLNNSGNQIHEMHSMHCAELCARVSQAWQSLVRVHRTLGCPRSNSLREDFKRELNETIERLAAGLTISLVAQIRDWSKRPEFTLNATCERLGQRHQVEIDLYLDSLETQASSNDVHPMTQQYNFYGNVGAVQSGSYATANVYQSLSGDEKQSLDRALAQVRSALAAGATISDQQRVELLAIIDECTKEMTSSTPNNTKLMSMFNVIGTTVQALADARPAYEALKGAVACLGVVLP
jgi:hypothetical protein